jgi:flagellar hook protein FlgE
MTTGAAGLRAHSEALGVTGDNIANVSTVGFKRSRANFEDVLGRSVAGATAIPLGGSGSRLAHVQQMWQQGALITTGAPTDLALSGDGLFIVSGNSDGVDGDFYTRAGQFTLDQAGFIVNPDGLRLQGYPAEDDGRLSAVVGDLQVEGGTVAAVPTANVALATNLDARAVPPAGGFNPADPANTSNFSTTSRVYDSLGTAHDVTLYFVNTAAGAWDWHALVDGGELTGGTAGTPTESASGTLAFNTAGALTAETTVASTWNFVGATPGQVIAFDFGTSIAEGGTGLGQTTQFSSVSSVAALTQDGSAAGQVSAIRIESDGVITGVFENGQTRTLGQVAVADFANTTGLARNGNNLWSETRDSGLPLVGAGGTGGRGLIVSGSLEASNVDLGSEFVDLIQYQRGFSANSKIITTADEMYQELVNIKR